MNESVFLVDRFEEHRPHLRAVAYRILGSLSEADDAVQEAWLRADRADTSEVDNLGGWLTTVVARVCLNMLRSREHRREQSLDAQVTDPTESEGPGSDPEHEAVMADSVGVALLVVLDTLSPAERLAFVLHDMFAVPFENIAPMLERSPAATRQLASRARRRVRGAEPSSVVDQGRRRRVVDAFLTATRGGDFQALVALLHPDVVLRADKAVVPTPQPLLFRGAETVAKGAMAAMERAWFTGPVVIDGAVGLIMAPQGRIRLILTFAITDAGITEIDVIAEPERLERLTLTVPED